MSSDTKDKPVLFTPMSRPIMDSSLACCVHAIVRCKLLGAESSLVRQSVRKSMLIPAQNNVVPSTHKEMFFLPFSKTKLVTVFGLFGASTIYAVKFEVAFFAIDNIFTPKYSFLHCLICLFV